MANNKKITPIYISIITYILLCNCINLPKNISTLLIPQLFWIIIALLSIYLTKDKKTRIKNKTNKIQTIFIITLSYLIIYYLSGLVIGFSRTIYSHTFLNIIKNIWIYIIPIIFIELTRQSLTKTIYKNNKALLLIAILFALSEIDINLLLTTTDPTKLLKLIACNIIPIITTNLTLTYTSKFCGYEGNLIYKIIPQLTTILLPITTSFDWYLESIINILLPIITYIVLKNENDKYENYESRRRYNKEKITNLLPIIIPIIIFVLFVAGIFKYKPVSIMSNSMHPIYDRGDVVIVEKSSDKLINKLKKYDIIEYILDDTIVAHRIIYIEKHNDGTRLYTTKGDNNNAPDTKKVTKSQILGKVIFRIPKIGYPSVWLNDLLNKNKKVNVETGKTN